MAESQSVGKCAELRQGCRDAVFSHIDARHNEVMAELGQIKSKLAYREGLENGHRDTDNRPPVARRRLSWKEVAVAVAVIATVILSVGAVLRGGMSHAELVKVVREVLAQEKKP